MRQPSQHLFLRNNFEVRSQYNHNTQDKCDPQFQIQGDQGLGLMANDLSRAKYDKGDK